jgi:hypothetical protein
MALISASDWRGFEQIVAAIQRAEHHGAVVKWNDEIEGRQFDVTVRFDAARYHYLVVIECRRHNRAVTAEQVDAFVTKSRDVNANKVIIASTSGFQRGAIEVARRHGIDLVTVAEEEAHSPAHVTNRTTPVLHIGNVRLHVLGGDPIAFSDDPPRLHYQMKHTLLRGRTEPMTVEHLADNLTREDRIPPLKQTAFSKEWVFSEPVLASGEPLDGEAHVTKVSFDCEVNDARIMDPDCHLDPHVLGRMNLVYRLQNVVTAEDWTFGDALKFDTVLRPGRFYVQPAIGFSYYCQSVDDGQATIFLVESYQHGNLFKAKLRQSVDESYHYLEVEDQREIRRLEKHLAPLLR